MKFNVLYWPVMQLSYLVVLTEAELFSCFSELWLICNLHPQRTSDRVQTYGHSNSATSDCYQEDYAQTSGSWGGLVCPPFLCQPCGQTSKPFSSSTCSSFLRYSLNPQPAHLQCPGEVGPAWPPASSSRWAPFCPAAHSQPCTGTVHACPAQRSRLCLRTTTARLLPYVSGCLSRTAPSRRASSGWLELQETWAAPHPDIPTSRPQEDLHHRCAAKPCTLLLWTSCSTKGKKAF